MNQRARRERSLIPHRFSIGQLCVAVLALACGSAEESAPAASSAPAPPPPKVLPGDDVGAPSDDTAGPTAPVQTPAPIVDEAAPAEPGAGPPAAGEPPPARRCDRRVSFDELYAIIESDLSAEGPEDGAFLRYISLGNRLNEGICSEDLGGDRLALIKAVNSLSTEVRVALPEALDAERTLYRIDLRDYGWDRAVTVDGVAFEDKWEAIIAASPYAVELEGDAADEAKLTAGSAVPLLFSDALIDVAMVGELYYELIGIGATEDELLAQLGIDEEQQEEDGTVRRAGTTASRMSREASLVERLEVEAFQGYFWSRYDVAASNAQSIFADPLGFEEDSITAVFSLRNGMSGYALFDAQGVRQAETDIILDPQQRDGVAQNGVSCSGCHVGGINAVRDEVRAYAEANAVTFDADTFDEILDAFPAQAELDELMSQDNALYRAALARAGLDTMTRDPVSAAYFRFDADVTLESAAGLLGQSPDDLSRELTLIGSRVNPALYALATGALSRAQLDAFYLGALCVLLTTAENRPLAADCAQAAP